MYFAGGEGKGGSDWVVVAGEAPRIEAIGEHDTVLGGQATDRVTVADPVDAVVVAFTREARPIVAMEPVERHDAGAVGVPTGLPAVDEAMLTEGGVHVAVGGGVEIGADDDGQMLEVGELINDDIDGPAP